MYNPQLDTFLRVADAGSFSKAAEEMYITPTAVIKQINLLEGNLGVMLFIRTHRGLHLTEAGKAFYQEAQYIVEYIKGTVPMIYNEICLRQMKFILDERNTFGMKFACRRMGDRDG
ncbi:MAG: LysR family transcriptional regulator [Clostridiales bacterium]|nr:LysR family transcriptional regulator [Clostridiales bacterium]